MYTTSGLFQISDSSLDCRCFSFLFLTNSSSGRTSVVRVSTFDVSLASCCVSVEMFVRSACDCDAAAAVLLPIDSKLSCLTMSACVRGRCRNSATSFATTCSLQGKEHSEKVLRRIGLKRL